MLYKLKVPIFGIACNKDFIADVNNTTLLCGEIIIYLNRITPTHNIVILKSPEAN